MNVSAPVVTNAGPLMILAKLNLLHLLKELYGRIHFTESVYEETVSEGVRQGYEDALTLSLFLDQVNWRADSLDVSQVPVDLREARLDRGERDTLALAQVLGSRLVLMDELLGREAARARGFAVRGSLGILVEAYRRNLMNADQLRLNVAEMARRRDSGSARTWPSGFWERPWGSDVEALTGVVLCGGGGPLGQRMSKVANTAVQSFA